jgi:hypothetical protein
MFDRHNQQYGQPFLRHISNSHPQERDNTGGLAASFEQHSPVMFRQEHQEHLKGFLTETMRGNSKKAMSLWQRMFPTALEKRRSEIQVEIVDMMGEAFMNEGRIHLEWQAKAAQEIIIARNTELILRARENLLDSVIGYLQSTGKKYADMSFSTIQAFDNERKRCATISDGDFKEQHLKDMEEKTYAELWLMKNALYESYQYVMDVSKSRVR